MNGMFNWDPKPGQEIASPYLYIYWVITVPVTALVYVAWFWWFKYSQKHYAKRHEQSLAEVEKQLKLAVRSATGTW